MDRHAAVFDGENTLSIAGLAYMEHTAVRVKVSRIYTVLQCGSGAGIGISISISIGIGIGIGIGIAASADQNTAGEYCCREQSDFFL